MRHDWGNALKYQDNREEFRTLPLNPGESEKTCRPAGSLQLLTAAKMLRVETLKEQISRVPVGTGKTKKRAAFVSFRHGK
jgi:hypothetical protein